MSQTGMASSASEPSITVRRARLDDFDAVLRINEGLYDGCDYIPLYYKDIIDDQDFHCYIAEVDGQLAAFECFILLDEEQTVMTRSARVKDGYTGMGLLKHMRKRINEDFKNIPTLKRLRTSCTNLVRLVHSKTFRLENKTLLQRDLMTFETPTKDSITQDISDSEREAKSIHLTQFSQLLDVKPLKNYLFPHGIFTAVSWFFDTLPGNMKFVEKLNPFVVITHHLYHHLKPESSAEFFHTSNQHWTQYSYGVIGIGTHYFCSRGLMYYVDVYGVPSKGREEEDISALFKHHVIHLQNILRNSHVKSVVFGISKTEGAPEEWFKNAIIPLGFNFSELNTKYKNQYYFEQEF